MGRDMQKEEGWETTRLCFALVREKLNARFEEYCGAWVIITVRRSRQSGVARATCPD